MPRAEKAAIRRSRTAPVRALRLRSSPLAASRAAGLMARTPPMQRLPGRRLLRAIPRRLAGRVRRLVRQRAMAPAAARMMARPTMWWTLAALRAGQRLVAARPITLSLGTRARVAIPAVARAPARAAILAARAMVVPDRPINLPAKVAFGRGTTRP